MVEDGTAVRRGSPSRGWDAWGSDTSLPQIPESSPLENATGNSTRFLSAAQCKDPTTITHSQPSWICKVDSAPLTEEWKCQASVVSILTVLLANWLHGCLTDDVYVEVFSEADVSVGGGVGGRASSLLNCLMCLVDTEPASNWGEDGYVSRGRKERVGRERAQSSANLIDRSLL